MSWTLVVQVILGTHLMLALTQQWIIPNVVNSLLPFSRWETTSEHVAQLAVLCSFLMTS